MNDELLTTALKTGLVFMEDDEKVCVLLRESCCQPPPIPGWWT